MVDHSFGVFEMQPKGNPWKRQRELKKQDIPTPQSIIQTCLGFNSLMKRCLFALLYLTGGRCSEVVKCKYLRKNIYKQERRTDKYGVEKMYIKRNIHETPLIEKVEKVELNYPGITKGDITFGTTQDKEIMTISMQNRKNKDYKRKNIPITVSKESKMISVIREYLATLPSTDTPLFPICVRKAEYILAETPYNPHFLRDIRLTHMVMIYDFNAFQLVKFAGWKDIKPAEKYIRLGIKDIIY